MCGIAGAFAYAGGGGAVDRGEISRAAAAMARRGPDGEGYWQSQDARVALAHRRLAIIDLSPAGAQPMASADGGLTITFNGEIYNYRELRRGLEREGFAFRSESDTEVLLALYARHGVGMLKLLRGMFAFGIWDERQRSLFLARDPFGIKPLYYADDGRTLRFASQVKALTATHAVDTGPDPAGSVGFLLWGCVPEPFTLHRGIASIPAGNHLTVCDSGKPRLGAYFALRAELVEAHAGAREFRPDDREELAEHLRDAVRHHLVADVPVGSFLSAGVDSTLITNLAARASSTKLRSLTLGFDEYRGSADDEVPLAERSAAAIGTEHATHWIRRDDFTESLGAILEAMDQPTTDGVNSWFVCRAAARAGLKVALSGLGGDELFGGYPSFRDVPRLARWLRAAAFAPWVGKLARAGAAPVLSRFTSPKYAGVLEYGGRFEGAYLLRRALYMPWEIRDVLDPVSVHVGLERLHTLPRLAATIEGLDDSRSRVAALEMAWYMRNQLLRDADWAGMWHSVEVRVPFVDVELFRRVAPWLASGQAPTKADAAASLPQPMGQEILARSKSGFSVPVQDWQQSLEIAPRPPRRGLRDWALRVLPKQPRPFRALVLATEAYGGHGGIAKFNRDLIGAIAAMPECIEAVVASRLEPGEMEPLPPRVAVANETVGGKVRYSLLATARGLRGPYDVIIVGHINMTALGAFLSVLLRAPAALVVHGIDAWSAHRSALIRASLRRMDRVLGVSELTLERFARWAPVPPERFRLLPNCVDLARFRPGPRSQALEERLGLTGRIVIMTFGRLASEERYKGFDEVIEALPSLAREVPNISYLICGSGPDRKRLEEKAKALGVADRVVFAGYVPEASKPDYYRLADAYVMPSRGEGFGIVFLEALACGLPAMGSRLDGSREALMQGRMGRLVDPGDAVEVKDGITKTLACAKRVPPELAAFSNEAFVGLAAGHLRELVYRCAPSNRKDLACRSSTTHAGS